MPTADTVLVPLCIGLTLVGVLVVVLAARRGRRGRVLQGLALALAPTALLLTGLLRLLWDAVVSVVTWVRGSVFDLTAWIGFGALALCVVLWVVGGFWARRAPKAVKGAPAEPAGAGSSRQVTAGRTTTQQPTRSPAPKQQQKAQPDAQDDDMAEIEALLRSRGIQ